MTDGLKIAIEQLERQKAAIEKALVVLREIDGPVAPVTKRAYKKREAAPAPKKRTMSEEGRRRIGEATRKRWAAKRAANAKAAKKTR